MDYTKVPRSIIYQNITDIGDFGVDDESSLMGRFFNSMLDQQFMRDVVNAEEILFTVFNNAFYICTLICLEKRPRLYFVRYLTIASNDHMDGVWEFHIMPSTMALVYSLLICSGIYTTEDKFMQSIWNHFKDWNYRSGYSHGKENFYSQIFTSYKLLPSQLMNLPGHNMFSVSQGLSFRFEPRSIDSLFSIGSPIIKSEDFVDGLDYLLNVLFEEYDGEKGYDEEERQWLLPLIAEPIEDLFLGDRMLNQKNRKHFDAYLKIQEAFKRAGLKWKSPYVDEEPTKQETDKETSEDETTERKNIIDVARFKNRIKELEAENKELKAQKPTQKPNNEDTASLKQQIADLEKEKQLLSQDKEDMIIELLKPIFYGDEQDVKDFLKKIDGRSDTEITDTVYEYLKVRKISDKSKNRPLWMVLHAARLYRATEQNWTKALREHP